MNKYLEKVAKIVKKKKIKVKPSAQASRKFNRAPVRKTK